MTCKRMLIKLPQLIGYQDDQCIEIFPVYYNCNHLIISQLAGTLKIPKFSMDIHIHTYTIVHWTWYKHM